MKKLFILGLMLMPLMGCSASIGTPPSSTTTYTTTTVPAATHTTVTTY